MGKAAVLLVFVSLAQAAAPATCIGWEPDAAARKACCKRASHAHGQDQSAADDCCAKHESARLATTAAGNQASAWIVEPMTFALVAFGGGFVAVGNDAGVPPPALCILHPPPDLFSPPLRI